MQALFDVFKPERTFRPQKKFGKGMFHTYELTFKYFNLSVLT